MFKYKKYGLTAGGLIESRQRGGRKPERNHAKGSIPADRSRWRSSSICLAIRS
jgi:hypothetical protein